MDTYFDLSEKQRSQLTEEQVSAFCDVALMTAGIIKPVQPERLVDVAGDVDLDTETVWITGGILFRSQEDALAFLKLSPMKEEYDFGVGYEYKYAELINELPAAKAVYRKSALDAAKKVLSQRSAKKEAIKKQIEEYNAQCKKANDATSNIWQDWTACRDMARAYQRVRDTFDQYVGMTAGDKSLALKFLRKAHTSEDIAGAIEWGIIDEDNAVQAIEAGVGA
jgi:hypothetical protein